MNEAKRFFLHLKFHLLEEYRLQTGFVGRFQFIFFPVLMTVLVFVISAASPYILEDVPPRRGLGILHIIMLVYGLMLGGFALFGEAIAEKRWGKVNLLLASPFTHPLSFKYNFLVFYVKDIIYYVFFSLIPIGLGILLSIPFTDHSPADIGLLMFSLFLTFLLGISFSFFLSSIMVRVKPLAAVILMVLGAGIICGFFLPFYGPENLLPSLMFNLDLWWPYIPLTLALVFDFSVLAVLLVKVEHSKPKEVNKPEVLRNKRLFRFTKGYAAFMAKEWIDLKRTRMLGTFFGVYIGPLIFIALVLWFFSKVLDMALPINSIFFAALIGFLGVTAYSFLNLLDSQRFNQTLPISVPQLIRTKVIMFLMLTVFTSSIYIIGISIFLKDVGILWVALAVSLSTMVYTVVVTAYLTGLRTNTYLFSPKILAKFWFMVVTPLVFIMISSFIMENTFLLPVILIFSICALMLIMAVFFFNRIENNWAGESFLE